MRLCLMRLTVRQLTGQCIRGSERKFDPRIFHVQLILNYIGDVNGRRVVDVGCGKGRFARVVSERNPRTQITAMDLSTGMLKFVPQGIHRCCASMTSLPFATGAFDAAYATESLEHAVDIEATVGEMCRVVTRGGRIVIIDKNVEHWGRLETPAWERWFSRAELEKMLRKHCSHVSSQMISYWEDVPPDGLFIAWLAER